ncbi:hypothetical protein [Halalkalibacterium halodurans]|uniref:Uncharacterized protein n=1 Tax=Halalkalibacterium halodurans TaxID=86665 RepID=A0A0M0KIR9_ALKHA|nr:hypothetical protein [Halalkalibacterium halodurans]TPE65929.1 hypothetical protein AMD02_019895 [Halalkalibacterium halodurans]
MARIDGSQTIAFGSYVDIKHKERQTLQVPLKVKWYGWPFLYWKADRKSPDLKWYHYPYVVTLIGVLTVEKWTKALMGKERERHGDNDS